MKPEVQDTMPQREQMTLCLDLEECRWKLSFLPFEQRCGVCRALDSNDPDDCLGSVSTQSGNPEKKVANCKLPVVDMSAELLLPWICNVCEMTVKSIEIYSSLSSLLICIRSISLHSHFISVVIIVSSYRLY